MRAVRLGDAAGAGEAVHALSQQHVLATRDAMPPLRQRAIRAHDGGLCVLHVPRLDLLRSKARALRRVLAWTVHGISSHLLLPGMPCRHFSAPQRIRLFPGLHTLQLGARRPLAWLLGVRRLPTGDYGHHGVYLRRMPPRILQHGRRRVVRAMPRWNLCSKLVSREVRNMPPG